MEVKTGCKKTEVGVIPKDWDVTPLGKIGESLIGLTYKPTDVCSDGILVLRSSNVHEGTLRFNDNVFVKMEIPERIMVRPGDILICVRNGSRDLIGKCAQIDDRARGMTFGAFMAVFRSPFHNFIYHQFQSRVIKKQIHEHLGATINQITNKSLNAFNVPLPPTKAEQEAIAEALSDADALIESLGQLLTKKRHIKQGAMQELLTGKKRLPGFSGKWEVTVFGSVAERIVGGGTPSRIVARFWNGDVPWMTVKDFARHSPLGTLEYITKEGLKNSASHLIPKRTLITSTRMGLGKAVIFEVDVSINQDLKAIFPIKDADTRFLYYWFQFNEARIADMGSGSTVMGLSLGELKKIPFTKPPFPEQTAIAGILSDMDTEIAALESKLAKARDIKQGMMQELLTGKIRLA